MTPLVGMQPFDPAALLWIALLNPAVIIVAVLMGRAADQWQKVVVAGFAAALAGAVLIWLATFFQVIPARGIGGEAGLFAMSVVYGTALAAVSYALSRRDGAR